MVQFPRSRLRTLCIQIRIAASLLLGYPIRPPTDRGMCAPPRRFSQLTAAFLAIARLGIHHKPFFRLTILLFRPADSPAERALSVQSLTTPQFVNDLPYPLAADTFYWAGKELNFRPLPYQSSALTD